MKFPPPHRDSAERCLLRAHALASTDSAGATALASLATAHAVLAHLDALKADLDRSGVTSGSDDHAQTIETPAPVAPGATNTGSLEYLDQPAVSSRVSSEDQDGGVELRRSLADVIFDGIDIAMRNRDATPNHVYQDALGAADRLLASGWRPPLPKVDTLRAEVRSVLDEKPTCDHGTATDTYCWPCAQHDRGVELAAYAAPSPLPADENEWEWGYRPSPDEPGLVFASADERAARERVEKGKLRTLVRRRVSGWVEVKQS